VSLDAIPALDPDALYEECPDCHTAGGGCTTCWDAGLVPHTCNEERP